MMNHQIEALYKQHHEGMLQKARTLLGNDDEANDVVSDVFAELLTKGKILDEQQAESYLLISVRNKCFNLLEHRRVVRESTAKLTADIEDTAYEEPPVDEVIDYVNTQLKPNAQRVIEQHFLHKKKYGEIAHDMGVSRFTVYKHLSQGISQLRAHFAWYQLVIIFVLLSGVAYALYIRLRSPRPPQTHTSVPLYQRTSKPMPTVIHYEDAKLEQILTDITQYNKVELHFLSDESRHLRLHYDWHQSEPLADIVNTLNSFESINIELRQNILYVK